MPYISYESYNNYLKYRKIVENSLDYETESTPEDTTIGEKLVIQGYINHPDNLFLHRRQYVLPSCGHAAKIEAY